MSKSIFIPEIAAKVAKIFEQNGGEFITPAKIIAEKISKITCFVFDWDGVFNTGRKGAEKTSDFAEPDTMALHIIRYAYWRKHGVLPIIAIITGVDNQSAYKLAQRDHLTHVFAGFKDKTEPLEMLKNIYNLKKENIATIFDDIIDYPLAIGSELRFLVRRNASPLFMNYFKENKLCDYITYSQQPDYPVREVAELIIGLSGKYDDMLASRFKEKEQYLEFWNTRQAVETKIHMA